MNEIQNIFCDLYLSDLYKKFNVSLKLAVHLTTAIRIDLAFDYFKLLRNWLKRVKQKTLNQLEYCVTKDIYSGQKFVAEPASL